MRRTLWGVAGLVALAVASGVVVVGVARADADPPAMLAARVQIAAHPDDVAGYDAYALAAFGARRWDEAIAYVKIGIKRNPNWAEGFYKLAFAYRQEQRWTDAAEASHKASRLAPDRADTYFGWGVAADKAGDLATARTAYLRYVALEKSPAKQRFVDQAQKRAAEIAPPAPTVVPPPPVAAPVAPVAPAAPAPPAHHASDDTSDDPPTLRAMAGELHGAGRFDEAVPLYEKAIALDGANPDAYAGLGRALLHLHRYKDAVAPLTAATERDPRFASAWYDLAHALRRADRKVEAVAAFRRYIELRPDDADPYYGLGETLRAMGDVAGALSALRHYVATERRPAQQSWVAKARRDVEALEARGPAGATTGRRDAVSADVLALRDGDDLLGAELVTDDGPSSHMAANREWWRTHDLKDPFPVMELAGMPLRDLRDPWPRSTEGLVNPFAASTSGVDVAVERDPWPRSSQGLIDPFTNVPVDDEPRTEQLRHYDSALVNYDRALSRSRRPETDSDVLRARRVLDIARAALRPR